MKSRLLNFLLQHVSVVVLILFCSAFSIAVFAEAPVPKLPHPKGKTECVEPTDVMRKQHMEFLLHQRDETMYKGIRTKKYSLKECIDCHAVSDDNGQPVSHLNPKHFCVQCHEYASVRMDCFDCHASKPRSKTAKMMEFTSNE